MLPDELDLLLVEADPAEAELLLRPLGELADAGRIGVARDGEEALDYLLGRGAYRHRLGGLLPRLVLLELKLPGSTASRCCASLRASPRTGTVPVVVLTSSAETREVAQCYQAGANSCIRKPIEFAEFADTVRQLGRYWLRLNRAAPGGVALG